MPRNKARVGRRSLRGQEESSCGILQRTNAKNSKLIFPEKELLDHSPNFHIHVSVGDLYIPTIDLPILLQEYVDRSWEYINRS
jgi:hypothetical protein